MADKLMYIKMIIQKIISSADKNYWLKPLNTQPNKPTNKNSLKSPMNKKTLLKNFGD